MELIKNCLITLLVLVASFAMNVHAENPATQSPVGYWKSIDKTTGKTKHIIQIWQAQDKTLTAKIVKVFPNYKDKQDQLILGAVILSGLMAHENQWKGGKMIDPDNGKSYPCSIGLAENGKKLNLKGYQLGIPLLSKSQTWERVDLMSDSESLKNSEMR